MVCMEEVIVGIGLSYRCLLLAVVSSSDAVHFILNRETLGALRVSLLIVLRKPSIVVFVVLCRFKRLVKRVW